jgi:hypothetical protein
MEHPVNNPQPLQQPHPPILIGGMGPRKTLRMVAEYADACNFFGGRGDDALRASLETLKLRCREAGRPFEEIEKTVLDTIRVEGERTDVVARGKHLHEMGFEHIIFNLQGDYSSENLRYLTEEVAPALNAL